MSAAEFHDPAREKREERSERKYIYFSRKEKETGKETEKETEKETKKETFIPNGLSSQKIQQDW